MPRRRTALTQMLEYQLIVLTRRAHFDVNNSNYSGKLVNWLVHSTRSFIPKRR